MRFYFFNLMLFIYVQFTFESMKNFDDISCLQLGFNNCVMNY